MRALTATETSQVAGAQDTWVFMGEPISVANIQAIKDSFYSSVFNGATAGAVGGLVRGPTGVAVGTLAGAIAGGAGWAFSVSVSVPMITYTPVITITEIAPATTDGSSGSCY
jgi:hypothetical protein